MFEASRDLEGEVFGYVCTEVVSYGSENMCWHDIHLGGLVTEARKLWIQVFQIFPEWLYS